MADRCRGPWFAPHHGLLAFLLLTLSVLCANPPATAEPAESSPSQDQLNAQRTAYVQATKALARGEYQRFSTLKAQLQGYPLLPYLDYADLSSRIQRLTPADIDHFLASHGTSPPGRLLRLRWLNHLAAGKRWSTFLHYHDDSLVSADLPCLHVYAQYVEGDRQLGVSEGRALWRVGKSQPKACDALFQRLHMDGHIDDNLAWQRYVAALLNHNTTLTTYVSRFFTNPQTKANAALYAQVEQNPRLIAESHRFTAKTPEESQLIRHSLNHLAGLDARQALALWQRYRQSHSFSPKDEEDVVATLVKALYTAGHKSAADDYLTQVPDRLTVDLLDWRLRELVKARDWQTLLALSAKLEQPLTADIRWKYWRARALALSGNQHPETSRQLFAEVSRERSFYGFLASEWLQTPYQMQHEPLPISEADLAELAATPAFQRIRELYFHRELEWARREWTGYLTGKEQKQWVVAARLAQRWDWHHQAIMSMAQAVYWNDIDIRFPRPYQDHFATQGQATAIPVNLLMALARQESAFNEAAVSPVGARGLMQLMPATARETARKYGIGLSGNADLSDPRRNIQLGSRYYREMLNRFNDNRILATAAYNAGPGRVAGWRRNTASTLPFDVWIEIIPFKETRNYVQNVLAFSMIYAHHLGLETTMLSAREKTTPL